MNNRSGTLRRDFRGEPRLDLGHALDTHTPSLLVDKWRRRPVIQPFSLGSDTMETGDGGSKDDPDRIVVLAEEEVVELDQGSVPQQQQQQQQPESSRKGSEGRRAPVSSSSSSFYRRYSSPKPPKKPRPKPLETRRSSGILRLESAAPSQNLGQVSAHSGSEKSITFCTKSKLTTADPEPHSPAPSADRVSVTFADPGPEAAPQSSPNPKNEGSTTVGIADDAAI